MIRRGSVEDLPPTAELWNRANKHYGRTLAVEHQGHVIIESIARRMTNDDADLLIAEVEGNLAGMLLGSPVREDRGKGPIIQGLAIVSWVAVDPGHWGHGIATRLMEDLLDVLRAKKFRRVILWTHQDNVRAQRMYERLGFTLSGEQTNDSAGALVIQYGRDL
ncbi:MAG: GNAT family N-acetyltransferase [Candidatus Eremiobacteraeota bacterium]|nr:GNAT family N-acetyltransferase [Candidatus Eremiobacteraeota bacterium]